MKKSLLLIFFIIIITGLIAKNDQSFSDKLSFFDKENIKGYLSPLANTIGAGINSGLYTTAETPTFFSFSVKVGTAMINVPSSDKTFIAKAPSIDISALGISGIDSIQLWKEVETATVLGKKNGGNPYPFNNNLDSDQILALQLAGLDVPSPFSLPGGINLPTVPLPVMSLSVGIYHTEVFFRGLPEIKLDPEIGNISYFGIGLKHGLDQYLPFCPVDIAAQYVYQNMKLTKHLEISANALNIHASKSLLLLTLYGGVGIESSNIQVKYDYQPKDAFNDPVGDPKTTKIDFNGANSFKANIGLKYSLLPFIGIYGDYNIAKYGSINGGLEISANF
jgi:hypothetical protein